MRETQADILRKQLLQEHTVGSVLGLNMGCTNLKAISHTDGMSDHAVAIVGYDSDTERAEQVAVTTVPNGARLQRPQDMSALRIPRVLVTVDIQIFFLQICNKIKFSNKI